MNNEKRYALTLDVYVYAESDKDAIEKAKAALKLLDDNDYGLPVILNLVEMPFGSLQVRPITLKQ